MIKITVFAVLCVLLCQNQNEAAKILGIAHQPSKSHYILEAALLKALAKKGHEITLISPFKLDEPMPNLREIVLESPDKSSWMLELMKLMSDPNASKLRKLIEVTRALYHFSKIVWDNEEVQKLIETREKFDVAISIPFHSDSLLGLSHYLGASNIFFSPIGSVYLTGKYVNNLITPYVPNKMLTMTDETSFYERVCTIVSIAGAFLVEKWYVQRTQQSLLDAYLPQSPAIEQLVENVSLVLSNSHYSIEPPQPAVPNYILIGGFYSTKPKKLPKSLKIVLDNAKNGAVLFCMGTNVKIADIEVSKLNAILDGLENISPIPILFKSEIDIPNKPENLIVESWIPQNDVLAHPNIKAFVTHGGLGGITEALSNGVPTLAIPFYGDQEQNALEGVKLGTTVLLKISDLNEISFFKALHEVLDNPKYAQNAKLRSELMKDQPIDPLEHAIYWVEHVIKYKGASHLRNAGMKLTWYQNYMVDIILFVVGMLLIVFYVLYRISTACTKKII